MILGRKMLGSLTSKVVSGSLLHLDGNFSRSFFEIFLD